MYEYGQLLTLYAVTPIHIGSGQSISFIDLPIQRERHTGFPILRSNGIKGALRSVAERVWKDKAKVETVFGPEDDASKFAGCVSITDARILFYPVRSVRGVFAWITSPIVLRRFQEDLRSIGKEINIKVLKNGKEVPSNLNLEENEAILFSDGLIKDGKLFLEEFAFNPILNAPENVDWDFFNTIIPSDELVGLLRTHLVIVSDNVFRDLVNYAVEVRTRIRINQATGTVERGALFTEEFIPSESIFYSLLNISEPHNKEVFEKAEKVREEVKDLINRCKIIQVGGDESLGKGFIRLNLC
ncbi:type III-B CRISPR module RAMP protein Cmr4 [Aquifex aeolicus]|uniref:CRISPR type III-associated protein domain-containing protein n=1 Tax=Aquifex aeolicus (strain VF5) TaxID=224324 RepID=O66702_AQUAE|nr:type III-B CRISPR module RAMP protein Cmr4 [Aquifex aeolicus]AAC06662.1 putative protein [Aquifex aeolicus VF5]